MPPVSSPGSRNSIIAWTVVFAVLWVAFFIVAIYFYAKANQAQALFNYSGATDAGAQDRERTLKDADRQMRSVDAAIKARLAGKSTGQPGEYARRLNW